LCYITGMRIDFYTTPAGNRPVEEFILSLSVDDQALVKRIYKGIELEGTKYPYVTFKPLTGKLWEIKFKSHTGQYRIAYVIITGPKMYWLHAFKKKTRKTPPQELDLALKRMKEVLNHESK